MLLANKNAPVVSGGARTDTARGSYHADSIKCNRFREPDLADAAMRFAAERAQAESDVLAVALAAPSGGFPLLSQLGVIPGHFVNDDLRIVAAAGFIANSLGTIGVLRLAREGLRRAGFWDASQIAGNVGSMVWSDASLARFACSWFYSDSLLRTYALRLLTVDRRQELAERSYLTCLHALKGVSHE